MLTGPSLPSAPPLTITSSGADVLLSWPVLAGHFQLQYTVAIDGASVWSPVTENPSNDGQLHSVVLPANAGQSFFRLVQVP